MPPAAAGAVHARIIANPSAGGGRGTDALHSAAGVLAGSGWTVSVHWTSQPGEAEHVARDAAAAGHDVVVAAGGDGTVNEVANGLVHSRTALAVLPLGTGNVLAAQLGLVGIPTPLYRPDVLAAAHALAHGRIATIDTGLARPLRGPARHFVLWAGIGFDAQVAQELEGSGRALKRRFGGFAYGALGLRAALGLRGTPARLRVDQQRVEGRLLMGVVANVSLYAGAVDLLPEAVLDDGQLDVAIFMGERLREAIGHVSAVLRRRAFATPDRVLVSARQVRVVARRNLAVHLDAEPFGSTPIRFSVVPASLRLVVPPSAPARLFSQPAGEPL
jgi:YegS/Rv2252/BmrU family lipid kinase